MSYYNQQPPPVGVPPQQGYPPPETYGKDAYPPPGYPPQSYPPPAYPAQGYPPPYAPQYAQPPPPQRNSSGPGCLEGWCALSLSPYVSWLLSAAAASWMRASEKTLHRLYFVLEHRKIMNE
ncbi:putative cysteine-rich and transmembrane domain-containing [Sesbania bispinosa]|nr:putative cysteine-rich and transmembrane domain-containing [Sesbania bispinosa]